MRGDHSAQCALLIAPYAGWWSRRIDDEHRIVYRVEGDAVQIAQLRFHY
tara:strand:+ start:411 stop:557 length:147 start_codon:yes stop_codon:yes gene_type:complete